MIKPEIGVGEMNAATLKALKGSIRKWKKIEAGTGEDRGIQNCPLCLLFYKFSPTCCTGCPVAEKAGRPGCRNTPYRKWRSASYFNPEYGYMATNRKSRAAAKNMRVFLESLLPVKKVKP